MKKKCQKNVIIDIYKPLSHSYFIGEKMEKRFYSFKGMIPPNGRGEI